MKKTLLFKWSTLCAIMLPSCIVFAILSCMITPGGYNFFKVMLGLFSVATFITGIITGALAISEYTYPEKEQK